MVHKRVQRPAAATIGFAADANGRGIVYAKIWATSVGARAAKTRLEPIVRVGFTAPLRPALQGREVAYAAVETIAKELLRLEIDSVELCVADSAIATDLAERRSVPAGLQLPYIALRCTLNRFSTFSVTTCDDGTARDLTARARAEILLDHAA